MRGAVPAKDFVGRYGGDEFIAILYQTDRRGVKNVLLALQTLFDAADKYMYTNKQREKLGRQD